MNMPVLLYKHRGENTSEGERPRGKWRLFELFSPAEPDLDPPLFFPVT